MRTCAAASTWEAAHRPARAAPEWDYVRQLRRLPREVRRTWRRQRRALSRTLSWEGLKELASLVAAITAVIASGKLLLGYTQRGAPTQRGHVLGRGGGDAGGHAGGGESDEDDGEVGEGGDRDGDDGPRIRGRRPLTGIEEQLVFEPTAAVEGEETEVGTETTARLQGAAVSESSAKVRQRARQANAAQGAAAVPVGSVPDGASDQVRASAQFAAEMARRRQQQLAAASKRQGM